jgi:hypothetical protein
LSVRRKDVSKLLISSLSGEVFHVEVASLLRVLVSEFLFLFLGLSFVLGEGSLDIELQLFCLTFFVHYFTHNFAIQLFDSILGATRGSLAILLVFVEADKAEGTGLVLHYDYGRDSSVCGEEVFEVSFLPVSREVLDIEVVEGFLEFCLRSRCESNSLDSFFVVLGTFNGNVS